MQIIKDLYLEVSRVEFLSFCHKLEQFAILERVLEPLFEILDHEDLVAQVLIVSKVHQNGKLLDLLKK